MFTEITVLIKKISKVLVFPYKRNSHSNKKHISSNDTFGGFAERDWINVGNDIRRGILDYGNNKFK